MLAPQLGLRGRRAVARNSNLYIRLDGLKRSRRHIDAISRAANALAPSRIGRKAALKEIAYFGEHALKQVIFGTGRRRRA